MASSPGFQSSPGPWDNISPNLFYGQYLYQVNNGFPSPTEFPPSMVPHRNKAAYNIPWQKDGPLWRWYPFPECYRGGSLKSDHISLNTRPEPHRFIPVFPRQDTLHHPLVTLPQAIGQLKQASFESEFFIQSVSEICLGGNSL
jgi:hypothetical protein